MNQNGKKWNGLSSSSLKLIALLFMIIDHFAVAIYLQLPGFDKNMYVCLRYIGRLSFPIYCFLLVEGFFHTHDVKKYFLRLLAMAFISEIPFDLVHSGKVWDLSGQNVYFTLSIGLFVVFLIHRYSGFSEKNICIQILTVAIGAYLSQIFELDYHYMGVLTIVFFYYVKLVISPWIRDLLGLLFLLFDVPASLAMIPIHMYNGKRGFSGKAFFYFAYPVHLLIFGLIRILYLC